MPEILNRDWLPGNVCFGCGHENHHGLRIDVTLDPDDPHALTGTFRPPEHASGFPGVTHGGALFTAMDCLATWVMAVFGPRNARYWLLASATVTYHRAARVGDTFTLHGRLAEPGPADGRGAVHAEVRDQQGRVVAEADFTEVAVPPEQFRHIAGIAEIPPAWRALFERTADPGHPELAGGG